MTPALRVPAAEQAGRVRHRLHRQRQEQPGADPQGPAAAPRPHRRRPGRSSRSSTRRTSRSTTPRCGSAGTSTRPTRTARSPSRSAPARAGSRSCSIRRSRTARPCSDAFVARLLPAPGRELRAVGRDSTSIAKRCSTRKTAPLVVRPGLTLNGTPVSLEAARRRASCRSPRPISTASPSSTGDSRTSSCSRTASRSTSSTSRRGWRRCSFTLTAKVKNLSTGTRRSTSRPRESFTLNEIDRTDKIEDLHLVEVGGELRHRAARQDGRARSRPAGASSRSSTATSREPVQRRRCKTDPAGRDRARAAGRTSRPSPRPARKGRRTPGRCAATGTPIRSRCTPRPANGRAAVSAAARHRRPKPAAKPAVRERTLAVRAARRHVRRRPVRDTCAIKNGLLIDRQARRRATTTCCLKSTGRTDPRPHRRRATQHGLRARRRCGSWKRRPLTAAADRVDRRRTTTEVTIQLRNASKFARVHVFATRYRAGVSRVRAPRPRSATPSRTCSSTSPAESVYLTGRNIGDEYRYVLDRKYAAEVPRQHARTAAAAAEPVGGPLDRDRRAGRRRRRRLRRARGEPRAAATRRREAAEPRQPPAPAATSPTSTSSPTPRPCW